MNNNKGFTLVELAIVLVIIGVILGGVMKGQQLVASAKSKRIMRDFQTIQSAVYAYQDKMGRLPGDDDAATATGIITTDTTKPFWLDLRAEELYPGSATDTSNPNDVYGGAITPGNSAATTAGLARNAICFAAVPTDQAESIDKNYDDAVPNTGVIYVSADVATAATAAYPTATTSVVCIQLEQ